LAVTERVEGVLGTEHEAGLGFSLTGFLDDDVGLVDDVEAQSFFEQELHPFVSAPSLVSLLERVRRWNRAHPERRVRHFCLDFEWAAGDVLGSKLEPYFQALDPGLRVSPARLRSPRGGPELWARLAELLERARREPFEAPYPFLTPEYVERVLENLRDTLALLDFNVDRQHAILRKVSDLGAQHLGAGLAIFKGGSFHARKAAPGAGGLWTEAAFPEHEFEPTRGRVRTLRLPGLGVGFAQVASLDCARPTDWAPTSCGSTQSTALA
jgi:hypothetical protein